MLPIAIAIYLHTRLECRSVVAKNVVVGFLFGMAAIMKLHSAIGLPILILFDLAAGNNACNELSTDKRRSSARSKSIAKAILSAALGFLVPIACALLYLWLAGAMSSFIDIARNYCPLYGSLSGSHETISGLHRMKYLLDQYRTLGGLAIWVVPSMIGAYVALYGSTLKDRQLRKVRLVITLAIGYSVYPIFAGQFWPYHWLPFLYFALQLGALCLVEQPHDTSRSKRLFPVLVLAIIIALAMPLRIFNDIGKSVSGYVEAPKKGRVDEIATYLKANLEPGDTVQPLDWTGGAIHAMLIARARIATRFVYDFHFYHHVSSDYTRNLRREFIRDLERAKPRYIIAVIGEDKPWPRGVDTTREFEQLQSFLEANYRVVFEKDDYIIYRLECQRASIVMRGDLRNP